MKKIAIVGTAPSRSHAPVDDEGWEIWACSIGNVTLKRVDRWFEMHEPDAMIQLGHGDWLRKMNAEAEAGKPVYITSAHPMLPAAQLYPIERMVDQYGDAFFTSAISYMLALAIYEAMEKGIKDIGIYGVEMANESEIYSYQRDAALHFISIARLVGINVHFPPDCALLRPNKRYGYAIDHPVYAVMRKQVALVEQQISMIENVIREQERNLIALIGRREAFRLSLSHFAAGE